MNLVWKNAQLFNPIGSKSDWIHQKAVDMEGCAKHCRTVRREKLSQIDVCYERTLGARKDAASQFLIASSTVVKSRQGKEPAGNATDPEVLDRGLRHPFSRGAAATASHAG